MWSRNNLSRSNSAISSRSASSTRLAKYEQAGLGQQDGQTERTLWSPPKELESPIDTPIQQFPSVSSYSLVSPTSMSGMQGTTEQEYLPRQYEPWQPRNRGSAEHQEQLYRHESESITSQESHSTLAEEPLKNTSEIVEDILKRDSELIARPTPVVISQKDHPISTITVLPTSTSLQAADPKPEESISVNPLSAGGPLAAQLALVLSHVQSLEASRPTIMAVDHQQLQARVNALEAEKKTWQARQEGLYGLRDDDVANLIKVRGLLATERREREAEQLKYAALGRLMQEHTQNLVQVRGKLAHLTWATEKKAAVEKKGTTTPAVSARQSIKEGGDLWRAAKSAALEHRILELEQANSDLRSKLETASTTSAIRSSSTFGLNSDPPVESSRLRDRLNIKVSKLRLENESLRKEVSHLEDRNLELEEIVHRRHRDL